MKIPHFFKAYCRLGIPNVPLRMSELNIGVEDAPDAILSKDFLVGFPKAQVSEYKFPNPEDIESKNYWQTLCLHLKGAKLKIDQELKAGETQIVVGGDNSVTLSSLLAVLERVNPKKVGYIQFDSHGEENSFKGSISKNFHGMYMRPFLEDFDVKIVNDLVPNKLPSENFLTIGNLDLDPDEVEVYKRHNLKNFNKANIADAAEYLKAFIQQFDQIHINFDVDVMDQSITPAIGIPTENGLFPEHIFPLLEIIRTCPDWSLDLAEVNPKKEGALKTIQVVQKILQFMLI